MRFYVSRLRMTEGEGTVSVERVAVFEVEADRGQAAIDAVRRERGVSLLPGEVFSASPLRPSTWDRGVDRVWVAT